MINLARPLPPETSSSHQDLLHSYRFRPPRCSFALSTHEEEGAPRSSALSFPACSTIAETPRSMRCCSHSPMKAVASPPTLVAPAFLPLLPALAGFAQQLPSPPQE